MVTKVKIIIKNFITSIQRLIVVISLFLIYIFGFGLTAIFMIVFKKNFLENSPAKKDTFWIDANGYNPNIEEAFRQS